MQRYFQWLVGDDRGKVVELVDITQEDGEYFYNFDDGESCNLSYICPGTSDKKMLRGKAMVEVPGPHNAWTFEEIKMGSFMTAEHEHVDVPPLADILNQSENGTLEQSAVGTLNMIPPKNNHVKNMPLPDIREYLRENRNPKPAPAPVPTQKPVELGGPNTPKVNPVPEQHVRSSNVSVTVHDNTEESVAKPVKKDVSDPVHILVNTCKKHPTEINLTVTLNLPGRGTYNFAKDEFENGDEKFISCLVDMISTEEIENALKKALEDAYKGNEN
jgi:hypothetical protein